MTGAVLGARLALKLASQQCANAAMRGLLLVEADGRVSGSRAPSGRYAVLGGNRMFGFNTPLSQRSCGNVSAGARRLGPTSIFLQ